VSRFLDRFFILHPAPDPAWSLRRRAVYAVYRLAMVLCAGLCMGLALLVLSIGPYPNDILFGYLRSWLILALNAVPVALLVLLLYGALGRAWTAFLAGGGIALNMVTQGLIAALVVLVLTQGYGKKGIGIVTGILGSLYNGITGYFSDIMSYSRLMALMLAGAVVAQVFNKLGAITGNIFTFFIIAMIGNALNFALNILGCFVHDMRLQCLEFFGRFYEDGGKPFRPLNINTKYVDIEK